MATTRHAMQTETFPAADESRAPVRHRLYAVWKRVFDLFGALLALLPGVPIMGFCALFIMLDSRGPVLFVDQRLGRGAKTFKCYKLRTMHVDGDQVLATHFRERPEAHHEWLMFKKLRDEDPRVTRVGRVLRKFSLDELPQVWNVIRGEMSLVGPRPYLLREWDEMSAWRHVILTVKPGITGLWQVSGRNELSFAQRMRLEAWYARHQSVGLDLWLLLKTVGVVLSRRGAY